MKRFAVFVLFAVFATGALAHSRVDTTTPEDGAIIESVPAEIQFNFANDIRLTRVKLTYADSAPVQLDLSNHKRFDRAFSLPIEGMGSGTYWIEWRGLGVDGHAMQGDLTFTVE